MAPVLKQGLFCCLSLRTCALILGSITLIGNLLTLSMFVVSLDLWLNESDFHVWNHTSHLDGGHLDPHLEGLLDAHLEGHPEGAGAAASHHDAVANLSLAVAHHHPHHPSADADSDAHPWAHDDPEDYFDGIDDSEAMEELLERSPHLALALVWFDFVLVLLETLAVILLIWGAAKRKAELLLPWLGVELFTTLYDLGFFAYLFLSNDVYIAIDLMPILLLPITVYCWLVVYSLYQECKETSSRNATIPLSMSALEAGGAGAAACTVPYGRMAA